MKKLFAITLLAFAASVANALPRDADIPLPIPGNGQITSHGGTLAVSLQPLLVGVYYKVECTITNPSQNPVGMVFSTGGGIGTINSFILNGKDLSSSSNQGNLVAGENDIVSPAIETTTYSTQPTVNFLNADQSNTTVTVSNCIAHFMSQKH